MPNLPSSSPPQPASSQQCRQWDKARAAMTQGKTGDSSPRVEIVAHDGKRSRLRRTSARTRLAHLPILPFAAQSQYRVR